MLNRTWRPALSVTGVEAACRRWHSAGNVLRPYTAVKLSLRLPPTLMAAPEISKRLLESDPPYGAKVSFELEKASGLERAGPGRLAGIWAVDRAYPAPVSRAPPAYMGEGGTIPFMGMLGESSRRAVPHHRRAGAALNGCTARTGFLHPHRRRVTAVVAQVVAEHCQASAKGSDRRRSQPAAHSHHGDHGCCC